MSAEDLIFLIRHDRGKVNRLRTYLSWKDVRKHAKDSGGDAGGAVEVDALEEGGIASLHSLHNTDIFSREAHNQSPEDYY